MFEGGRICIAYVAWFVRRRKKEEEVVVGKRILRSVGLMQACLEKGKGRGSGGLFLLPGLDYGGGTVWFGEGWAGSERFSIPEGDEEQGRRRGGEGGEGEIRPRGGGSEPQEPLRGWNRSRDYKIAKSQKYS